MAFPIVKGSVSEGFSNFIEAVKNGVFWLGRVIKEGCIKLGEAIKAAWDSAYPYLKDAALKTFEFLKTPAGFSVLGGLIGIALGVSAEAVNEKKHVAIALRVAAAAAFVGAGIAIGIGITYGFLTPVV